MLIMMLIISIYIYFCILAAFLNDDGGTTKSVLVRAAASYLSVCLFLVQRVCA